MRAVHADDVHPGQHLVQAVPIGRLQLIFNHLIDPAPVVIVDLQAKCLRAASHGLAGASTTLSGHVRHFDIGENVAKPEPVKEVPPTFTTAEPEQDKESSPPPVVQQQEAAKAYFAGAGGVAEKLEDEDENWEEF